MRPAELLGWYLALLVGALLLAWLYQRSRCSILVVAVFHAVLDITINTPTSSTLIPTLMSVTLLLAGVAVIPSSGTSAAEHAWRPGPKANRPEPSRSCGPWPARRRLPR
jgi:hypothetical protein